jgi:suppressor of fused-like protein
MVIDARVSAADGGPAHSWYHPRATRSFSGPGPVEAVGVYLPGDHWHLVTCGLTELHAKESPDATTSGWGFELTFRLGPADPQDPPLWAVDFLAAMASYVWSSRHPFSDGHLVDMGGSVKMDADSAITAAVVVEDPGLGVSAGPNGQVQFLQIVGLTAAELELCRSWNVDGVVELLARQDPMLVTVLDRPDLTEDPALADEIIERSGRDGSALHELRVASLKLERGMRGRATVEMGAGAATALGPALRRELVAKGASFAVVGDTGEIRFEVGEPPLWRWTEAGIEAVVALDGVEYVAGLFDGRTGSGRASDWPGLRFRVVK